MEKGKICFEIIRIYSLSSTGPFLFFPTMLKIHVLSCELLLLWKCLVSELDNSNEVCRHLKWFVIQSWRIDVEVFTHWWTAEIISIMTKTFLCKLPTLLWFIIELVDWTFDQFDQLWMIYQFKASTCQCCLITINSLP